MATLRTLYEVAVRGGTETEAQLRNVGKVGAEAFKKIDDAAKTVPTSLRAVDAAASTIKGKIDGLAASAGPLGAALSAIGGPLGLIGIAATGASVGVLALAKSAIAVGDNIADSAKAVGLGVEQFQALQFGARLAGVETTQLEGALKKFGTGVAAAGVGTGALVKTLEVLDPALLGTIQHATSVEQAFTAMAAKIAATKDPFEQVQLAVASFGAKSAEAMLPVIANLEATTKRANELHIIMGGDLIRSADSAQDALDTLGQTVRVNLDAALIALAPTIEATANKLADLAARIGGFFQSITGLEATENLLAKLRNERDNLDNAAPGTVPAAKRGQLDQKIADLEAERRAILANKDAEAAAAAARDKAATTRHAAFLKLATDHDDAVAAEKASTKAASEAASAQKKAADQAERNAEETIKFQNEAAQAGLDGIALIEEKRDEALAEQERRFEQGLISEEDFASRRVAINLKAERDITAERAQEDAKRADAAVRVAEREQRIAERNAERLAEEINRPVEEAFEAIGRVGQDALEAFASGAHVTFEDIANDLKSTIIHALIELAKQQILLSIGASITGGSAGGVAGGGGGGGFGGILQTGQQLLSLGKTFKSGVDTFSSVFGLGTETLGAAATTFGTSVATFGEAAGSIEAALFGIENAGTLAISGAAGVAPGTGALLVDAAGNVIGTAGASATTASAASGLVGGATTAGILVAVVAALEGIMGVVAASKTRDAAFGNADTRRAFMSAFDPITMGIANITAFIAGGQNATNLLAQDQRILFGGASTKDKLMFAASLTATPLGPMLIPLLAFAATLKPPTKGTALRKSFEEFVENGPPGSPGFGFFARDSGTFKRGIGQTGLSANDVHARDILSTRRESIGLGARGIAREKGIDFVEAQKEFIELQRESIGLTIEQEKQVTALGVAFRALIGPKAGEEESRVFGVIADLLGSINAEGAGAAEAIDLVQEAVAALGRPALVFDKLNQFFLSDANDIGVKEYRDAIQGLAAALFNDLPKGVDAAALALRELDKAGDGKVTFEQIETAIKGAVVEAEALGPALEEAFQTGFTTEGLNVEQFSADVFDQIGEGLKVTIAQAVFDGFIAGAFKGDVLGPFLETLEETIKKVKSGEITQEDANRILVDATREAKANLETFKPLIEQAVTAGKELATAFDDVSQAAEDAARAILSTAFQELAVTVVADPGAFGDGTGFVSDAAIAAFHDSVLTAMHDAVLNGFVSAMVEGVIEPAILAPFTAAGQQIVADVTSGAITPEEGARRLAAAFADVDAALEKLDPVVREFITNVVQVGTALETTNRLAGNDLLANAFLKTGSGVAGSPRDFVGNPIATDAAIESFHDAVLEAMRDATVQGFMQAMLEGALQEAVLAPFTAASAQIFGDIKSGAITPEEGQRRLAAAFAEADAALAKLDPALQTFITNVGRLGESIGDGGLSARDIAGATIDRQLLGALDPGLAKQFDLEVTQRQRLHDAKALGLDLTKVERLNALERAAIAKEAADELARIEEQRAQIEEQRADQIGRVMDQFFADVEQNLLALRDLVTTLTASPASPLPPEVAFANAQANLNDLFARAAAGDADALAKIPEAFQNAEGLARQLFGSTDRFFAFFGPALAKLEASGALDAESFKISPEVQAQIDAINQAADEQLAAIDKQITEANANHAEAMALFQAMLDALTLTPEGEEITQRGGGSGPGDIITREPEHGRPSSARFGIDTVDQAHIEGVLADLKAGGQTEKFLVELGALSSFAQVQAWAATDDPKGHLAATLLAIAPGVRSLDGWRTLIGAFRGKIRHPEVFSPVLGFGDGGSFVVPGRPGSGDIFPMLPNVRASPGETVTVTTHGMDQALRDLRDVNARIGVDTVATLRALQAQNAELLGRVATLERAILGEMARPRVPPVPTRVL